MQVGSKTREFIICKQEDEVHLLFTEMKKARELVHLQS